MKYLAFKHFLKVLVTTLITVGGIEDASIVLKECWKGQHRSYGWQQKHVIKKGSKMLCLLLQTFSFSRSNIVNVYLLQLKNCWDLLGDRYISILITISVHHCNWPFLCEGNVGIWSVFGLSGRTTGLISYGLMGWSSRTEISLDFGRVGMGRVGSAVIHLIEASDWLHRSLP